MALRIGLITDLHYADAAPRGTRHYRESLPKLQEALGVFRRERVDLLVHLGDLVDFGDRGANRADEAQHLKTMVGALAELPAEKHFVLGNHCVVSVSKREYLGTCGQARSFYSVDRGGVHLVFLDACFRRDQIPYDRAPFDWSDTEIPAFERAWLEADLARTSLPTLLFCHQRLDLPGAPKQAVASAGEVRRILEASGKVIGVWMGHSHENALQPIGGIRYATLMAMVEGSGPESNAYSVIAAGSDGRVTFAGFRQHARHPLA